MKTKRSTKVLAIAIVYASIGAILLTETAIAGDKYWKGSGASDNIDDGGNWWVGSGVVTGDNLWFDGVEGAKQPYCNKGGDAWYGTIITLDEPPAITWSGDTTYAYKFENQASPNLFKIQSNIANRDTFDLELNPVGSGGMQVTGNINISSPDKWLKIYGSDDLDISGIISGAGGVDMTIFNEPMVILRNANTFPHLFNIYGGIVDLHNADPLDCEMINLGKDSDAQNATIQIGASGVTVDNNVTVVSGSSGTKYIKQNHSSTGEFSGEITLNDNVTLSAIASSTLTMSGIISGAGKTLTLNDSGTVVLSGENTFGGTDGQIAIENGTLKVSDDDNLGADPAISDADYVTLNNWAVLCATGGFALNSKKGVQLNGNGKIYVNDGETLSYNGDITGNKEFAKDGLGTFRLDTEADIEASEIYIDSGTLWAKHTLPFDGSATTINLGAELGSNPASFKFGNSSSSLNTHSDVGVTVRSGSSGVKTIVNASGSGEYSNIKGQVILKDDLNVDASSGGELIFSGGVDMSGTGINNDDLTITGSDDVTISGVIDATTSAAEIIHNGTGTLTLSGDNTSDNQMKIKIENAGIVQLSHGNALGSAPGSSFPDKVNFLTSGILSNTVDVTLHSDLGMTIADGITATFGVGNESADDLKIYGPVSDASDNGQVLKKGPGALYLHGVNTYGGATTIENGTVRIVAASGLGDAPGVETDGHLTINGGTLINEDNNTTLTATRNVEIGANHATITTYDEKTLTIEGKIKGAGNLIKESGGELYLKGANTYDGSTTINNGELWIDDDSGLGTAPASPTPGHLTIGDGDMLWAYNNWSGALNANRGITINNSTIKVSPSKTMTYAGIIDGSTLTKSGTGTLVLTGPNTYSGGTTVSDGTLKGTTTSLQGDISINGSDDLEFDQTINGTYAGNISGDGDLTKSGSGTVTLSGTLTYTATTVIDDGAIVLNGDHTGGTTYTVNSGGTLGGSGSTDAAVTLDSGAVIRGGVSGTPDKLTLGSSLTLESGSSLVTELDGATPVSGYSQIDVSGTVTLGGATLDIVLNHAPVQGGKFILIDNNSPSDVVGNFAGLVTEGSDTIVATYGGNDYTFYVYYGAEGTTGATTGGNDVMLRDIRTPPSVFLFK